MESTGTLKVATPSHREVAMTRVFDAPRDLLFDALTKPKLLKRWFYGPPGWTLDVCEMDLQVGGAYRWVWRGADGTEMGVAGVFREVVIPERIVATERFDVPWYPGEAVVTQVLVENGAQTTLTLTVLYESQEARDIALRTPMTQGVEMGYNRLAEMLS